ncbi:Snf7-domain-containing protein [Punctularia strigosozonata HHB-11173 SS5]|uniref:Snf7-domain-containing protein n=1 Tax=Punctularia strigosozonata (strain HHB-11173) TaxID=741275 RepID=UPI0004417939|nr:Snf7-domain-containing protein [Punctularia strigosozonata HHB-11173 SS5]EIN07271.1 Snf7-domain-containing protein [Punctularia strigosozonata HHB-11173 SS5]
MSKAPFNPTTKTLSAFSSYSGISTSRLQALYSDFSRQKHSNPQSYQANIRWWQQTFEEAVKKGLLASENGRSRLVLHAEPTMAEVFRYEGAGKPLSLGTVTAELSTAPSSTSPPPLIPLQAFLTAPTSIYTPTSLAWRVASNVVGKPVWWALKQTGLVPDDVQPERERWRTAKGDYVVLALLEDAAEKILEMQERSYGTPKDLIFSLESFKTEFGSVVEGGLSDSDVKVVLKYLARDKGAVKVERELVKFIPTGLSGAEASITPVDHGLLELKTAVANLERQVESIQYQMDDRTAKTTAALRAQRKPMALTHLRAKKQLEDLLSKRLLSLEKLHSTLLDVERAVGDVEIMQTYELSTATLRSVLAHPSLQRDHIDDTMDALASATADAKEVDDAITDGVEIAAPTGVDDSDLEAELQALIREQQQDKARDKPTPALPDVPAHVPALHDASPGIATPEQVQAQ